MPSPKTIMILGASILQLPAIEKAAAMGLRVVALDWNPDAVGFGVPGVIREVVSTIDIPAAVETAGRYRIDGVMTLATDMPMRTVAAVAKAYGLVGIDKQTAIRATDKGVMRAALQAHGVPVPAFFRVRNDAEFRTAQNRLNGKMIVKPADSSGSRGVHLVTDPTDAQAAYADAKSFSRCGDVIVEEYMQGPEVSVETLAMNGDVRVIQITDKLTTGAPRFVETGHTQPSRLAAATREAIERVAIAANHAIGIENGPSHTEIIVTKDGPKVVEIGARLGGDCITTHLVPLSTGVDMVEACIRIALGETPDLARKAQRGAAIRYFDQHAGTVRFIEGLERARSMPGVRQVSVVHGVGERVTEITDSGSRMGFVIAEGETADDAEKNCEAALHAIRVGIGDAL